MKILMIDFPSRAEWSHSEWISDKMTKALIVLKASKQEKSTHAKR